MSIRVKILKQAVENAKRFVAAAEVAERAAGRSEYTKGDPWYEGGQYCAAVKRASMDLSKSLAGVRRGDGLSEGLGAWVPAQERVPAVGTECVVLVRYSLDRPPFATVDRWDVQREDPTGMGGPTIETGEGWSDNFDCDVIAWIEIPPYPSVMIDQLIELLRKRAQASGGDALLEEAVDDLPKIQASSVSDAWVWIDFSGTKLDKGTE